MKREGIIWTADDWARVDAAARDALYGTALLEATVADWCRIEGRDPEGP